MTISRSQIQGWTLNWTQDEAQGDHVNMSGLTTMNAGEALTIEVRANPGGTTLDILQCNLSALKVG